LRAFSRESQASETSKELSTIEEIGPLIILSGPSGSGKSTVIERAIQTTKLPLRLSVSATTRRPRPGERDGVHYYFWTPEQFEQEVQAGGFLEWAEVHGFRYGTLRREVVPFRQLGTGVILDIDVQGAKQMRGQFPEAVLVFLRTSTFETYEQRLRARGTEDEEKIQRRLDTARRELSAAADYDFLVINDDLDKAVNEFRAILVRQFERK
jgi:guanylate kinase